MHVVFLLACYQEDLHRRGSAKWSGTPALEELAETYGRSLCWDEDLWHVEVLVNWCEEVLERPSASSHSDLHLYLLDESPSEKVYYVEEH